MLQHLPVLPLLIPLLGGILLLLPPLADDRNRQRIMGTVLALLQLIVAVYLLWTVHQHGSRVYAMGDWQPPFGILLVADRLATLLLVLTAILLLCVQLFSSAGEDEKGKFFHPLLMFQTLGIQGAFLTGDLFNLFVFFEVLLIASYALLIHGGGAQKTLANVHYVSLNLAGSALFLFALGIMYGTFGTLNMADMQQKAAQIHSDDMRLASVGAMLLLVVFGLKSAMMPLHFWMPRAYAVAPAPVAALFAIMTKVGIYSLWRVHSGIFGDNAGELANIAQPWLWPLAWLTVVIGIIATLASQTLRELTANLVIISVGSLLLMVALNTPEATASGLYYLVHSTLATALMFLVAGLIVEQRGKAEDRFVQARPLAQPVLLGALFFMAALALIGMPPVSGFIGKALMLKAALAGNQAAWVWPPILLASLAALVMLSRSGGTLFWRARGDHPDDTRAHPAQLAAVILLAIIFPVMVVFAGWITDFAQLAAAEMQQGMVLNLPGGDDA
ncbi:monovalent cation/H+ antiporter subunit D [Pseudomaricurvus sp. HS19]|uniref:monovalent cation/H+ antiporter subunit D n=1 Tax=Pseudomaricurvus sp. HS19 TaxID=2692626 RepID=UPI001370928C|nr:monovalent cation/H+ antiporter subunit D [Pseudomaricurvus sp. HS19]MYM63142.1 monovalent cation/H+ antiporter subunit D [Pseudomaricurvus sp. HS19]